MVPAGEHNATAVKVCCGIEWAENDHDVAVVDADGKLVATRRIDEKSCVQKRPAPSSAAWAQGPRAWPLSE